MNKLKHFFGLDTDRIDASRYFKANGSFVLLFIIIMYLQPFLNRGIEEVLVLPLFLIFVVILVLTSIRRLRDAGKSPLWSLLLFTFVNLPFVIYLLAKPSKSIT